MNELLDITLVKVAADIKKVVMSIHVDPLALIQSKLMVRCRRETESRAASCALELNIEWRPDEAIETGKSIRQRAMGFGALGKVAAEVVEVEVMHVPCYFNPYTPRKVIILVGERDAQDSAYEKALAVQGTQIIV